MWLRRMRLNLRCRISIDGRLIFDAPMLREDVWDVCLKRLQDRISLPWLRGDDGDDVDHGGSLPAHEKAPTIFAR